MNRSPRPNICFLDPFCGVNQRSAQAGVSYYLSRAIHAHWGKVTAFGPLEAEVPIETRIKSKLWRTFSRKRYVVNWDPAYCRNLAAVADRRISENASDVVVTIFNQIVPFLASAVPILVRTDSTFLAARRMGYPGFARACTLSCRQAVRSEKAAFDRARLIIVSNHHGARAIVADHGTAPSKIAVIAHGPHLDVDPGPEAPADRMADGDTLRLLFVGSDWGRKGGPLLLEIFRALKRVNGRVQLTIVGCAPTNGMPSDQDVCVIERLNKDIPAEMAVLDSLFRKSHFLVLPTKAEACAIVYNEACAYSLPVVTTDVGGVRTAIKEGINGKLLPLVADARSWAKVITSAWQCQSQYAALCAGARQMFERYLNYDTCGRAIKMAWERISQGVPAMEDYSFLREPE